MRREVSSWLPPGGGSQILSDDLGASSLEEEKTGLFLPAREGGGSEAGSADPAVVLPFLARAVALFCLHRLYFLRCRDFGPRMPYLF